MKKFRESVGNVVDKISYAGMAVIFILMVITTVDVILRKVSTLSIRGSYELTEMGMLIIVFLGIAAFQVKRGHVRVDMFINKFPGRSKLIVDTIVQIIECVAGGFLIYGNLEKMLANGAKGISTSTLLIPTWPFCAIMMIGSILFTIMMVLDLILTIIDLVQYRKPSAEEVTT